MSKTKEYICENMNFEKDNPYPCSSCSGAEPHQEDAINTLNELCAEYEYELLESNDMKNENIQCCAGCKIYSAHEARHLPECPHYPESLSRLYDETATEIAELKDQLRWRSVEEELPPIRQLVLTINSDGAMNIKSFILESLDDELHFYGITHWLPIPSKIITR